MAAKKNVVITPELVELIEELGAVVTTLERCAPLAVQIMHPHKQLKRQQETSKLWMNELTEEIKGLVGKVTEAAEFYGPGMVEQQAAQAKKPAAPKPKGATAARKPAAKKEVAAA